MQSVVCCYDYSPDFIKPHPDIIMSYLNEAVLISMPQERQLAEIDIAVYSIMIQCPWSLEEFASACTADEDWHLMCRHWPINLMDVHEARRQAFELWMPLGGDDHSNRIGRNDLVQSVIDASIASRMMPIVAEIIDTVE